jgi:hypothetical protein
MDAPVPGGVFLVVNYYIDERGRLAPESGYAGHTVRGWDKELKIAMLSVGEGPGDIAHCAFVMDGLLRVLLFMGVIQVDHGRYHTTVVDGFVLMAYELCHATKSGVSGTAWIVTHEDSNAGGASVQVVLGNSNGDGVRATYDCTAKGGVVWGVTNARNGDEGEERGVKTADLRDVFERTLRHL